MDQTTLSLVELVVAVMLGIWTLYWAIRGFVTGHTVVIGRTLLLSRQTPVMSYTGNTAIFVSFIYLLFSAGFFWGAAGLFVKLLQ